MITISMEQLDPQLSGLIARVNVGEQVAIMDHGKLIATITSGTPPSVIVAKHKFPTPFLPTLDRSGKSLTDVLLEERYAE